MTDRFPALFASPSPFGALFPMLAQVSVAPRSGIELIDWIIIAIYAAATLCLGWYYGRQQTSTKEYFSGSGNMNPLLIGVSLFASLLSTISYLSTPGEVLGKGPIYLTNYLAYPFIFVIVAYVLLPVYMRVRVTSAYELLEERLGLSVRLLGATMFLLLRLVWMSLLIYAAAKAFCYIIAADAKYEPLVVVIAGAVALFYASLGGLRAVVVTDLMQSILLYGGAVLVIGVITHRMGFGWFPTEWNTNWDHQPILPESPSTRVSLLGTFLSVLIWYVATSGGDQVSVQRLMATKDVGAARRAIAMQLSCALLVGITLGLAGFAMLGYFQQHPEMLPEGHSLKSQADHVFPMFIGTHLPPIASGLVAAGLFSAAMSSMDSGINSITAVVSSDFVNRLRSREMSDVQQVRWARWLAVAVGLLVLAISTLIPYVPGNITEVTGKTVNLLTVPIFCLFFFALFYKRASTAGVWIGWAAGTTTAILISFSGPIFGFVETPSGLADPVSFQWIPVAALVVNVSVGMLFSAWLPNRKKAPAVR